jgi:hypothetical protein
VEVQDVAIPRRVPPSFPHGGGAGNADEEQIVAIPRRVPPSFPLNDGSETSGGDQHVAIPRRVPPSFPLLAFQPTENKPLKAPIPLTSSTAPSRLCIGSGRPRPMSPAIFLILRHLPAFFGLPLTSGGFGPLSRLAEIGRCTVRTVCQPRLRSPAGPGAGRVGSYRCRTGSPPSGRSAANARSLVVHHEPLKVLPFRVLSLNHRIAHRQPHRRRIAQQLKGMVHSLGSGLWKQREALAPPDFSCQKSLGRGPYRFRPLSPARRPRRARTLPSSRSRNPVRRRLCRGQLATPPACLERPFVLRLSRPTD